MSKELKENQYDTVIKAMHEGDREPIILLLSKLDTNMIANWSDELGLTFLHHAAAAGNKEIVNLLLEKAPSLIDKIASNGLTVLHLALKNAEIVRIIMDNRPDFICKKDDLGQSPISLAQQEKPQTILAQMLKHLTDNTISEVKTQLNLSQKARIPELEDKIKKAQNISQHLKDINLIENNPEENPINPLGENDE